MSIEMWLHMLYEYEMWCYDLGCIAIDRHAKQLNSWWDGL